MAVKFYTAVVEKSDSGAFFAFFPDIPGCTTSGDTVEECLVNAGIALADVLNDSKGDAPVSTPFDEVVVDDEVEVYVKSLIRYREPEKTIRTAISIDRGLLEDIDSVSNNRSGFLASAAREKLARY